MPVLELKDGTMMPESYSIARYLGTLYGYYPEDPRAALEVDCLVDGFEDVLKDAARPHFIPDPVAKEALINKVFDEILPKFLNVIEPICAKGEWIAGS